MEPCSESEPRMKHGSNTDKRTGIAFPDGRALPSAFYPCFIRVSSVAHFAVSGSIRGSLLEQLRHLLLRSLPQVGRPREVHLEQFELIRAADLARQLDIHRRIQRNLSAGAS